jgi:hypothetical protein
LVGFPQQSQFFGTPSRDSQGSVIGCWLSPFARLLLGQGDGLRWLVPRIGKQNRRYTVSLARWRRTRAIHWPFISLSRPCISIVVLYGCTQYCVSRNWVKVTCGCGCVDVTKEKKHSKPPSCFGGRNSSLGVIPPKPKHKGGRGSRRDFAFPCPPSTRLTRQR